MIPDLLDRIFDANAGCIAAACRRSLRYGFQQPAAAIRIHADLGDKEKDEYSFEMTIKAVDLTDLRRIANVKGLPELVVETIFEPKEGYFPCVLVDDGDVWDMKWYPLPDQN
jgi:hypothetical protein